MTFAPGRTAELWEFEREQTQANEMKRVQNSLHIEADMIMEALWRLWIWWAIKSCGILHLEGLALDEEEGARVRISKTHMFLYVPIISQLLILFESVQIVFDKMAGRFARELWK